MSEFREKLLMNTTPSVDIDMLRSFVAIAECGNMTKAARTVFRTPAAISMQVKKLESLLETTLLERTSRSISITPDGEKLLAYSRRILTLNQELVDGFIRPKLNGTVRLGLPEQFGTTDLPAILSQFSKAYSHVTVDVILGKSRDIKDKFERGDLDIGLVSLNLSDTTSHFLRFIRSDRLCWASLAGSSLPSKRPICLSLAESGCAWRSLAVEALDNARIDYRIAYTSDNYMAQSAAVEADLAIAALPESLLRKPVIEVSEQLHLPEIGSVQTYMMVSAQAAEATETLAHYIESVLKSSAFGG